LSYRNWDPFAFTSTASSIAGKGKSLYGVLHYYIVDTRPVHWVVGKVQGGYDATIDATETTGDTMTLRSQETLSQGSDMLKAIE
jgi:hypothetical protein